MEAFYQRLTGALPLTPAHPGLAGVGAHVRWKLVEAARETGSDSRKVEKGGDKRDLAVRGNSRKN